MLMEFVIFMAFSIQFSAPENPSMHPVRIVSDHRELCESLGGRGWFSGILGDRLGFPTSQELPGNGPVQHIQPGASLRLREFRYKGAKKLKLVRSPGSWSTHGG